MPTPTHPQINAAQAATANDIVSRGLGRLTCATALAAVRSDGNWNLYVHLGTTAAYADLPWFRITPDVSRSRMLSKPDAGAVWAGIEGMYIGDGEEIVEQGTYDDTPECMRRGFRDHIDAAERDLAHPELREQHGTSYHVRENAGCNKCGTADREEGSRYCSECIGEMECAALNASEGVRPVRGHGINE